MSKHFSIFSTETQFTTAAENLQYPHVSLIDTTGEIKYAKFTGLEVVNAAFGDILMAEVSTNKLFNIEESEYNLTDYPLESYKPIAVCIYDKASNANNQAVFLSVQWADYTDLGTPKATRKYMSWGFNNVNLSQTVTGIRDEGTNHVSSIYINTAMKSLVTKNYSGSSITDTYENGESTAFCSAWRFKTAGTSEGDWYLGSYYDLKKYQQNYSTINGIFSTIKTVAGSSYLNTVYDSIWVGAEYYDNKGFTIYLGNSTFSNNTKSSSASVAVRPVFIVQLQQL